MSDAETVFREEAGEHLENLEQALLCLDATPNDAEQINIAFRAMHTIKGSSGMVGFEHLSEFTHHLETLFERVRSGGLELTAEIINLVLECKDQIDDLLRSPVPENAQIQSSLALVGRLQQFTDGASARPEQHASVGCKDQSAGSNCYSIFVRPAATAFTDGMDVLPLIRELQGLGACGVSLRLAGTPEDPERCVLELQILIITDAGENALRDVFLFVCEDWQIDLRPLSPEAFRHNLNRFSAAGWLTEDKAKALQSLVPPADTERLQASDYQAHRTRLPEQSAKETRLAESELSIKVPQRKLDALMDQVGELVILQARLDQLAISREDETIGELAEELDRLSNNLRETTFDIRMLPIGSTFGRFRRLVRDLSRELGKNVALETAGAGTELDKVVLDKLADPLVHLLRNSLDHGIEMPETRLAAGKPEKGTIRLEAAHEQGRIIIRISDDGAGLDAGRILEKARKNGLVPQDVTPDTEAIYNLIFEPGFSTAARVSDVSGRGVGMDVVRTSIESLQGRVQLQSEPGEGTVITISLPMTLAIIDGLMVAVSGERFVIPLAVVDECIETRASESSRENGSRLVKHRDGLVPSLRLREWFAVAGQQPDIEQTVIVHVDKERFGITVDEVIGHSQTVIKSLGRLYRDAEGVMGATILGNGGIAMILDVAELIDDINSTAV
ncbi:chemotaxis protein CheA [Marinobacter salsuginis]|uniref:chemotaxis protein CheA n=1 Tax=Marinobacter salsuginis TaxID=418719 RepID=UPI001C95DBB0|nr:chemotaxis protein CheA [Marinobacter salsuginis]MBY6072011.1 chemotaxis protein CheA [Marinobacter salsuginis]